MRLGIEANGVYRPLWHSKKRYVILMGGRGAGRSFEASQLIIANLVQSKRLFRAAIMRAVHSDIRHSIWQELLDRVSGWELESICRIADSTMELGCGKNSVNAHGFRKSSHERTAKLKSLAGYTTAVIEEAEEAGEEEFRQLDDSLRAEGSQIYLLLNTPAKSHWIIKRWFDVVEYPEAPGFYSIRLKPGAEREVEFIHSSHLDNPYLAQAVHDRYEAYRDTKPAYYWQMIRGLCPEVVMGRIYKGWKEIAALPHEARLLGRGLDFGFDPDPAAVVAVYWHNGGYILNEEVYERHLQDADLATRIKLLPQPGAPIIADSAEPKAIATLKDNNVHATPCSKGADSVNFGIKHVQGLRISYTATSKNLKEEYENYAWKRRKDQVEENDHLGVEDPNCENHAMSAVRYFMMEMVKANADPEAEMREARSRLINTQRAREQAKSDAGL
jgi:phage terminase large subunit